jgi:hypothetical protein
MWSNSELFSGTSELDCQCYSDMARPSRHFVLPIYQKTPSLVGAFQVDEGNIVHATDTAIHDAGPRC